jgi:hypothetical protein
VLRREPTHPLWLKSCANASAVIRGRDVTTSVAIPPPVEDAIGPRRDAPSAGTAREGQMRERRRARERCARASG